MGPVQIAYPQNVCDQLLCLLRAGAAGRTNQIRQWQALGRSSVSLVAARHTPCLYLCELRRRSRCRRCSCLMPKVLPMRCVVASQMGTLVQLKRYEMRVDRTGRCDRGAQNGSLSSTRCTTTSSGSEFRVCSSSWSVVVLGISRPFLLPVNGCCQMDDTRSEGVASRTSTHSPDDPCPSHRCAHNGYSLCQLRLEHRVKVHRPTNRGQCILVREHAEATDV